MADEIDLQVDDCPCCLEQTVEVPVECPKHVMVLVASFTFVPKDIFI